MKFLLSSTLLLVLLAKQSNAAKFCDGQDDGGIVCQDCFKCVGAEDNGDGTKDVYIGTMDCDKSGNLSWMCYAEADGSVSGAEAEDINKDGKTRILHIQDIPLGKTTVTVQAHDGQIRGNEDVKTEFCSGNTPGGKCSSICTAEVDLSACQVDPPVFINDPHLKSWRGEWFDYMGECDLKLLHAPKFDKKQDLDIHVRTTIQYDYSFIEIAALRIGNDILEVGSYGQYTLNGVEGAVNKDFSLPTVGGYPVIHNKVNKKKHTFEVIISEDKNITLSNFKEFVSVKLFHGDRDTWGSVTGLMGNFDGKMLSRDGTDLRNDIDVLGQDWQIKEDEENMFRTVRAPQAPLNCILPDPAKKDTRRRLGERIAEEAANMACAHLKGKGSAFSSCVHDVMATGELDMAQSGAF